MPDLQGVAESAVKRPAFQFYPADWRKDAALQTCSMAAQGLWINLLCVMHECEPYGHLSINGKALQVAQIARLVGLTAKECEALLSELFAAGVSCLSGETIFSKRMVKDEQLRETRAACGRLGGNPVLVGSKVNQQDKQAPKVDPTPSSSSSSSPSVKREKKPAAPSLTVEELIAEGLTEETATEWLAHRNRKGARLTALAWKGFKTDVGRSGWTLERAIVKAISRGWTSFDAEWIKDAKGRNPDVERVTTRSDEAERTLRRMEEDRMTPEQREAANKAKELAMSAFKRVA